MKNKTLKQRIKKKRFDNRVKKANKFLRKAVSNYIGDKEISYYLQSFGADVIAWGYHRNAEILNENFWEENGELGYNHKQGAKFNKLYNSFVHADLSCDPNDYLETYSYAWVEAIFNDEEFKENSIIARVMKDKVGTTKNTYTEAFNEFFNNFKIMKDKVEEDLIKEKYPDYNEYSSSTYNQAIQEIKKALLMKAEYYYNLFLEGEDDELEKVIQEIENDKKIK